MRTKNTMFDAKLIECEQIMQCLMQNLSNANKKCNALMQKVSNAKNNTMFGARSIKCEQRIQCFDAKSIECEKMQCSMQKISNANKEYIA